MQFGTKIVVAMMNGLQLRLASTTKIEQYSSGQFVEQRLCGS